MSSLVSKTFNTVDDHVTRLYHHVSGVFDVNNVNSKFADVQLKIEAKIFYCHKIILAMSSNYFANLSFSSKTETLQNVNSDHFYDVLQFMYKGEVLVSTNNIESLLSAADVLGMDDLTKVCSQFLDYSFNTHADNALFYLVLAKKHKLKLTVLADNCQQTQGFMKSISIADAYVANASEEIIKCILSSDNLEVKNEVEVCEMLMNWLQVQAEAGHKVRPDKLLPLVRWSGIGVDYVKSRLLPNAVLSSDQASASFLTKVVTYLSSGVQFESLQTFHRPSTGLENCLMVIGLSDGDKTIESAEACRISLQLPDKVMPLSAIQINMCPGLCASYLNNNVYITGVGGISCKETWTWNISSGWIRCADMLTGRAFHSASVVDSMLYVMGGRIYTDKTTLSSVECYDINTNTWSAAGSLVHAVRHAACVAYKNSIYVFGGRDKDNQDVAHVQVYNPAQSSCTLLDKLPSTFSSRRAVLWETSVILLGRYTCLIYNFNTQTWQKRKQFKTGLHHFASTFENSTVYISGGGTPKTDKDNKQVWICTDEIKSVSVLDIIQNKPAKWTLHSRLPTPGIICAYINISLPLHI